MLLLRCAVQAAPILKDFASRWQGAIEDMHKEVSKQFPDGQSGRDVLQVGCWEVLGCAGGSHKVPC